MFKKIKKEENPCTSNYNIIKFSNKTITAYNSNYLIVVATN